MRDLLQAGCSSCHPTDDVKAPKRRWKTVKEGMKKGRNFKEGRKKERKEGTKKERKKQTNKEAKKNKETKKKQSNKETKKETKKEEDICTDIMICISNTIKRS